MSLLTAADDIIRNGVFKKPGFERGTDEGLAILKRESETIYMCLYIKRYASFPRSGNDKEQLLYLAKKCRQNNNFFLTTSVLTLLSHWLFLDSKKELSGIRISELAEKCAQDNITDSVVLLDFCADILADPDFPKTLGNESQLHYLVGMWQDKKYAGAALLDFMHLWLTFKN